MHQFKQQNSESPRIDVVVVALLVDHLGSHVLQGATVSLSFSFVLKAFRVTLHLVVNSPTEVADFDEMVVIDQEVFRLQIPMDVAFLLQEVDSCQSLDEVPKGLVFGQVFFLVDSREKVSLWNVLHH